MHPHVTGGAHGALGAENGAAVAMQKAARGLQARKDMRAYLAAVSFARNIRPEEDRFDKSKVPRVAEELVKLSGEQMQLKGHMARLEAKLDKVLETLRIAPLPAPVVLQATPKLPRAAPLAVPS